MSKERLLTRYEMERLIDYGCTVAEVNEERERRLNSGEGMSLAKIWCILAGMFFLRFIF